MTSINVDQKFQELFPKLYFDFMANNQSLKDFQKKVVKNVITKNNTLCIMPTGGGKSLIYWLSGLILNGITIVISPLIALIDEQAAKIEEQGYEVLTIHGGISASKQIELLKKFASKEINPKFIFASPERIATDGFFEYCIKIRKDEIKLIAIDEVHCVSQWGTSFRPFYKRIPFFLTELYGDLWNPIILALTATLNSKEVGEICTDFRIQSDNIIRDDQLIRSEINLKVLKFSNENEKEEKFWELLNIHKGEKILVYLYRKYHQRGVEELAAEAFSKGFKAVSFHGDMSGPERQNVIHDFKNNDIDVIFATNAFGMGIDIPDIRVVIHFMMPESVEQYYQEIGRAARDHGAANAYLLYTNKNIQVKKTHFINKSFPSPVDLITCFSKITSNQTGLKTLKYFDDEEIQKCFSYYLNDELISIICKGVANLNCLKDITDIRLKKIYDSTKTKSLIKSATNSGESVKQIVDLIYDSIIKNNVKLSKHLDKCLIIEPFVQEITDQKMTEIDLYIEERKAYKTKILDYFVYLLETQNTSMYLHQEIGHYLGVSKHNLNKLYATTKGDRVRSKSEVIIANLLFANSVDYVYEKELFYEPGKWIEPDFTIKTKSGKEIYWEHLGMIGIESYDKRWKEKQDIYRQCFPGQLEVTYEGTTISDSAHALIQRILSFD